MPKEILINVEPQERRIAIVNDGRLEQFYIERPQDKTIVGNIYKGKIEAALPSIGAAFVDIGLPKKGFLYLSEIGGAFELSDNPVQAASHKAVVSSPLTKAASHKAVVSSPLTKATSAQTGLKVEKGQEILVQVVKESFGTKGPRLTTDIGIAGRYLVLMPQGSQIGISRRIEDEAERKRLKQIFNELKLPTDIGFIVRTAACGKTKHELMRDAQFLIKLWKRLQKPIKEKKAPELIYEEYDLSLRVIRDSFTDEVSKLLVDSKVEFYRIQNFMRTFMNYLRNKVQFYKGDDLFADKDIEKQINRIFESKVYMKSKAYIIIEPTEGLVVIDVNSGGFKKGTSQEEAAFKVNCEAALEVSRQLVLRDLGGIIVIDFIDMEKERHRQEVLNILKKGLSGDRAKYDILGISKFGVIEMTRERIHRTTQMLSYQACPYCQGKGRVKSAVTMAIYSLKEIKRYLKISPSKQINVSLSTLVVDEILKNKEDIILLERKFRTKINLIPDPLLRIEDIKLFPVKNQN
ncbi:MAG: Rne/Rng family ribonuclease [Candidatus Omnitrophota bacterium]|nr:Rne/Rng family ribonuclease [Candidatus Omnitrophota bacterium]